MTTPDLVSRIRDALSNTPNVQEKKMFGTLAFMVNDKMCVTARPDRIMCRVDPKQHDTLIQRDGCATVIMGGREYRGYIHVDVAQLKTKRDLMFWLHRALSYNQILTSDKKI